MLETLIFLLGKKKIARPYSQNASILAKISMLSRCHYVASSDVFPKDGDPHFEQSTVETQLRLYFCFASKIFLMKLNISCPL